MPLPEYLQTMLDNLNERKNTINKLKLNEEYTEKDYDRDIQAYNAYKNRILVELVKLQPKLIEKGRDAIENQIRLKEAALQDAQRAYNERMQAAQNQNPEEANNPLYEIDLSDVAEETINFQGKIDELNRYKNSENGIKEFVKNKFFQEVKDVNLHARVGTYARIFVEEGNTADIENNPDMFAETNFEPLFEFYSDMLGEDEVLNAIGNVEYPEFSPAFQNYEITGDNDYDLIKGYRSQEFVNEKNAIVRQLADDAKNRSKATVEDFEKFKNANDEYKKYNDIYNITERNADTVKGMLCGLTAADGEKYEKRLRAIVTLIAKDNRIGKDKFMTMTGVDENLQHDFVTATKYVKELMTRTDAFGADTLTYTENIDFDKICAGAIERFDKPEITQEQVENTIAFMSNRGDNFVYDARAIKDIFDRCTTPEQVQSAYAKLIEDASKGNSTLEAFAREKVRTPERLAEFTEYIDRAYAFRAREDSNEIGVANIPGVDNPNVNEEKDSPLSMRGITPQFIKDKCEECLDGVKASIDMLRDFNSQLNRFRLTAEEYYAIHGFTRNETSKEFKKGTLKENGLQCHKEDVRLNDAIATYGRLKDIHAKRPFFFFLFHPNQNSKEKEALEYMRNTLKNNYHFTDAELDARVETVKAKATDGINKRFVETSDPERFKNMVAVQKANEKARTLTYDMEVAKIESKYRRNVPENMEVVKSKDPKKIIPDIYVEKDVEIEKDYKFANAEDAFEKWLNAISIVTQIRFDHANKDTLPMKDMTKEEIEEERKILPQKFKNISDDNVRKYVQIQEEESKQNSTIPEMFVDKDGYLLDKAERTNDNQESVVELLKIENATNAEEKERLKKVHEINEKIRAEKENLREINRSERCEKFFSELDKSEKQKQLAEIEKAKTENKSTEELQKKYDDKEKERQEFAKDNALRAKERDEKRREINKTIYGLKMQQIEVNKELNYSEKDTLAKMKEDMGLDLAKSTDLEQKGKVKLAQKVDPAKEVGKKDVNLNSGK